MQSRCIPISHLFKGQQSHSCHPSIVLSVAAAQQAQWTPIRVSRRFHNTASDKDAIAIDPQFPSSHEDLESVIAAVRTAANGESTQLISASIQGLSGSLGVVYVSDLQMFNVSDDERRTHAVSLFPLETCTCPASTTCCHIIAAERSIGIETTQRKPLALNILRTNSRRVSVRKLR